MPLPENAAVVKTSTGVVETLHELFGPHPGFRPAHAKGQVLSGTFKPSSTAAELSKAPHFTNPSTPIIARFSSSTGLPEIPDTAPDGNPRGLAVRFQLASTPVRKHTDIVAHSTPLFPVRTGEDFHAFITAAKTGQVPSFLSTHPETLKFIQYPKPFPEGFDTESYFSVSAFKLISSNGKETFVRYRFVPVKEAFLSEDQVKSKGDSYLYDKLSETLAKGPIKFKLQAQVAQQGDVVDDATQSWPDDRKIVDLGELTIDKAVQDSLEEQRKIIFDPIPRVEGVDVSGDPLTDVRAAVYLISGRERRAAAPA